MQSAVSIVQIAQKSKLIFVQSVEVNSNVAQTFCDRFVHFAKSIGKMHKNRDFLVEKFVQNTEQKNVLCECESQLRAKYVCGRPVKLHKSFPHC